MAVWSRQSPTLDRCPGGCDLLNRVLHDWFVEDEIIRGVEYERRRLDLRGVARRTLLWLISCSDYLVRIERLLGSEHADCLPVAHERHAERRPEVEHALTIVFGIGQHIRNVNGPAL